MGAAEHSESWANRPRTDLDLSLLTDEERRALSRGGEAQQSPEDERIGDRFRVLRRLGRGGMGEVLLAYDLEMDRRVAIKRVLSPELAADTSGSARWGLVRSILREARAMARPQLMHPNVVAVLGYIEDDAGNPCIVMEAIEGQTMAQWVRDSPGWRAIVDRMLAAGRGVVAAHEAGVLHCDLKPSNILIDNRGVGLTKVGDFGLASLLEGAVSVAGHGDSAPADRRGNSKDGAAPAKAAGTPAYMSPEQAAGLRLDPRSDQYGFCMTLYELLYRERPFGEWTTLEDRRRGVPRPERTYGVPRWLQAIIARGLEPRPESRHASMEALLHAIDRGRTRWRRWASWTGIGAVCLGAIGFGSTAVVDSSRRCGSAEAVVARASAEGHPRELRAYAGEFEAATRELCRVRESGLASSKELMHRQACLQVRGEALAAVVERAEAKSSRSTLLDLVSNLPAVEDCRRADVLAELVPMQPGLRETVTGVRGELARVRMTRLEGKFELARPQLESLRKRARAIEFAPLVAEVAAEQALVERFAFHIADAKPLMAEALNLATAAGHDRLKFELQTEAAWLVSVQEPVKDEANDLRRALDATYHRGEQSDLLAVHRLNAHARLGRWPSTGGGTGWIQQAVERYESSGLDRPRLALVLYNNLAYEQLEHGHFSLAIGGYERSIELLKRYYGPQSVELALPLGGLIWALTGSGDLRRAALELESAPVFMHGDSSEIRLNLDMAIGDLLSSSLDWPAAKSRNDRVLRALRNTRQPPGSFVVGLRMVEARYDFLLGRLDIADNGAREALQLVKERELDLSAQPYAIPCTRLVVDLANERPSNFVHACASSGRPFHTPDTRALLAMHEAQFVASKARVAAWQRFDTYLVDHYGEHHADRAWSLVQVARAQAMRGDLQSARSSARQALRLTRRAVVESPLWWWPRVVDALLEPNSHGLQGDVASSAPTEYEGLGPGLAGDLASLRALGACRDAQPDRAREFLSRAAAGYRRLAAQHQAELTRVAKLEADLDAGECPTQWIAPRAPTPEASGVAWMGPPVADDAGPRAQRRRLKSP